MVLQDTSEPSERGGEALREARRSESVRSVRDAVREVVREAVREVVRHVAREAMREVAREKARGFVPGCARGGASGAGVRRRTAPLRKARLSELKGADSPLRTHERLFAGAISGLLAQSATYPLDVIRRRVQVDTGGRNEVQVARPASVGPIKAAICRGTQFG